MLLAEKQQSIVEELSLIPDAYERLGYLVEYGKNLSKLDPSLKIDQFMIEGCLSQLWIVPKFESGSASFNPSQTQLLYMVLRDCFATFIVINLQKKSLIMMQVFSV